jgi:hypothetical protein
MAAAMNAVVYKSRVDLWLLVPLAALVLVGICTAYWLMRLQGRAPAMALLPLALVVAVLLWTMLGTRYTLSDEALQVRSGPFAWRIALTEVSGIEPTRDARSSPALSLDRLRIDYGHGRWLMISPADKQRFVRDFTARRARAPM